MNAELLKALLPLICQHQETAPDCFTAPRKVIVRSRDAGVIYGDFHSADGANIRIVNARQMWKWKAAKGHTLVDVADHGVDASGCKLSPSSANMTVFNACALIDVTNKAAISIEAA